MSRDGSHAKLTYYWYGSWTTLYNLFNDALLCFHLDGTSLSPSSSSTSAQTQPLDRDYNDQEQQPLNPDKKHHDHHHSDKSKNSSTGFVPRRIYEKQSDWYHAVRQRYGLPLDSRHLYTKTDWEFFATSVASKSVRNEIWKSYALWVNETSTGTSSFPPYTGHFVQNLLNFRGDRSALDGSPRHRRRRGFPGRVFHGSTRDWRAFCLFGA